MRVTCPGSALIHSPIATHEQNTLILLLMLSSLGSLLSAPPLRVAIVGAGAIGTEFALNHFGRQTGTVVEIGRASCRERV